MNYPHCWQTDVSKTEIGFCHFPSWKLSVTPHCLWDKIQTWWHYLHGLLKSNSKLPFMLSCLKFYSDSSNNKSNRSLNLLWFLSECYPVFLNIISAWRINTNKTTFTSQVFFGLPLHDIINYSLLYNHKNLLNTCALVQFVLSF